MYIAAPNSELRRAARQQLRGNWGGPILALFLCAAINIAVALIPFAGILIVFLCVGAFSLGINIYFLKIVRAQQPRVEDIFSGFRLFGKSLGLYLLMSLIVFLWSLIGAIPGVIISLNVDQTLGSVVSSLLSIPAIIVSLSYSQFMYILADNPDMKVTDILRTSKAMMNGFKMKYFLLGLSFIGWALLGILTLFIGYLWLVPYIHTAYTNFYEDVKNIYISGQLQEEQ